MNYVKIMIAVAWRSSSESDHLRNGHPRNFPRAMRFLVEREEAGVDGVLYLKLADGRGEDGRCLTRFHTEILIQ